MKLELCKGHPLLWTQLVVCTLINEEPKFSITFSYPAAPHIVVFIMNVPVCNLWGMTFRDRCKGQRVCINMEGPASIEEENAMILLIYAADDLLHLCTHTHTQSHPWIIFTKILSKLKKNLFVFLSSVQYQHQSNKLQQ